MRETVMNFPFVTAESLRQPESRCNRPRCERPRRTLGGDRRAAPAQMFAAGV